MEQKSRSNRIIEISKVEPVDMANEWFEIAPIEHFWIQWRFQALLKNNILKKFSNTRLLEIGCGHGIVMKQFETLKNITVDGCDLNPIALEHIEKGKGDIYLLNIFDKPEQLLNKYSGIILLDVLEHIEDDSAFLNTACSYLENGGLIIINVPALNILFSKYDQKMGHKRRYNKKMLQNLLEKNNIEIIGLKYWGFSLLPIVFIRKIILLFTKDENVVSNGFKLPGRITNFLLTTIMKLELFLFKTPPIGSSLTAVGKYTFRQ